LFVLAQTYPHPWLSLAKSILRDRFYRHVYVTRDPTSVAEFAVDSAETGIYPWGYIVSWFKRSIAVLATTGSIPDQYTWDWWWTACHGDRFPSKLVGFLQQYPIIILLFISDAIHVYG
jgi:hypothetical protein